MNQMFCSLDFAKSYAQNLIENKRNSYSKYIPTPKIIWKPMGRNFAGRALSGPNEIWLNTNYLTSESWKEFLDRTPLHELAHLITHYCYGGKGHGKVWKKVCVELGIEPVRCHHYKNPADVTGTTVKKMYSAHCKCKHWDLSSIRYNRIIKEGYTYTCPLCKNLIELDIKDVKNEN